MSDGQTRIVRVVLHWAEAEDSDQRLEEQILLDLLVDCRTDACVGPLPALGFYGSTKAADSLWPFILDARGVMDYGVFAEEAREEHLNIRDRPIRSGEYVTHTFEGEPSTYRIAKVTALGC